MLTYLDAASGSMSEQQKDTIFQLVCEADQEFVPCLSARESTRQTDFSTATGGGVKPVKYMEQLMRQQFILALEDNGDVIAFMSYIPGYELPVEPNDVVTYVSTIIVNPQYRRQGITSTFYDRIEKMGKIVATRTWSTNDGHLNLLRSRGYSQIKTLPNDRGEGIDTVYFYKNCEG